MTTNEQTTGADGKPVYSSVADEAIGAPPEHAFKVALELGAPMHTETTGLFPLVARHVTTLAITPPEEGDDVGTVVTIHTDYDLEVPDEAGAASEFDKLHGFLSDVVRALEAMRPGYLEAIRDQIERNLQATGPEGEPVSEDAK